MSGKSFDILGSKDGNCKENEKEVNFVDEQATEELKNHYEISKKAK